MTDKVGSLAVHLCEVIYGNCVCKITGWPDEHMARVQGTHCNESLCAAIAIDEASRLGEKLAYLQGRDWITERIILCLDIS